MDLSIPLSSSGGTADGSFTDAERGNQLPPRVFARACALVLALAMAACATGKLVEHGFGFDARWDSPGIEVLDFRYGRSSNLATMARPPGNVDPTVAQASSTYGLMPRPDRLFVRWRIRATGEAVEDMVDLDRRLPADIQARRVHFVIKGALLCVYLVSKDVLPREGLNKCTHLA